MTNSDMCPQNLGDRGEASQLGVVEKMVINREMYFNTIDTT